MRRARRRQQRPRGAQATDGAQRVARQDNSTRTSGCENEVFSVFQTRLRLACRCPPLFSWRCGGSACGAAASNWTGELRTCSLMHPVERACEIGSGVGSANKDGGLRERKRTRKADAELWLNRTAEEQQTSRHATLALVKCRLVLHAPMTSGRRPCCPLPPAAQPGSSSELVQRAVDEHRRPDICDHRRTIYAGIRGMGSRTGCIRSRSRPDEDAEEREETQWVSGLRRY